MPKVRFARTVGFRASHHYWREAWSEEENEKAFGEARIPHEHDWKLTVWLEAPIQAETGMSVSLPLVDRVLKEQVVARFDGRSFREGDAFFARNQPTTEVLAGYFLRVLAPHMAPARLVRVRIAEAEDLWAEALV